MIARALLPALFASACCIALAASVPAFAQGAAPAAPAAAQAAATNFKIGYVEIEDDPRYEREFVYALTMPNKTRVRIPAVPRYRPQPGAQLAIEEANQTGRFTRETYELVSHTGRDAQDLVAWIEKTRAEQGVNFFLIDANTDVIRAVSQAVRGQDVMLVNVANSDDRLRGQFCAQNLAHTAPSYNMLSDSVTQYLVFQGWVNILLLTGPLEEDVKLADALKRSIRRNGARLVEERKFIASNDPRQREQNNTRLLTGGSRDYDVVFIADTDGEFARTFPYQTVRARPVVGASGLQPEQWHWTWERQGAPQLSSRFHNAFNRVMYGPDWSAWAAVRSLALAQTKVKSIDYRAVREYFLSDQLRFDGYMGSPLDFRSWDHQLRMNVFLTLPNAVIARAPLDKFEHATNDLDTLGVDKPETTCRL
ncbi:MAG: amino acid ABC transporter substrate-binding protein [Synechococcaceae bacterium WBB_3_034]|nr:amino acid ABC transporter substrate-binding protein [Synechococcaceae bacterium WBB_3_034]